MSERTGRSLRAAGWSLFGWPRKQIGPMKIVAGLGNPGPSYTGTRHNIGFEVAEEFVRRHCEQNWSEKFDALLAEGSFGDEKVLVLKPLTYMNLSGRSVQAAVRFYKADASDLLVVTDDMNLGVGQLRLRGSGSAGGQNGLKDVIEKLGTDGFSRLRVGIGRPPGRTSSTDYVLGRPSRDDREVLDVAIQEAADGIEAWLAGDLQSAMNQVNTPKS